ncbi:hypothetical protein P22_1502 [Propionispora sp. 2/2-37]|uniref:flavin reductase family protein n=1 Tax=Propionispora sp. 2/2-37 TaxID=1677858 RepID=UPI0006BB58F0|nr:flavin reductase family protein [Propionispora sp. 2/2-37]CUH95431.1 hypothetical protein P22_1502 [Propionispora sp. 2/2-37]
MSRDVTYNELSAKALEILRKGAFLTTAGNNKINTMTIGWGNIGIAWQKPVFMVMVRPSRYTYELIEKSNEFTVSIPFKDMGRALGICGSKSGRELDKFAAAGLKTVAAKKISTPVIADCGLHYECKVIYKQEMIPEQLAAADQSACYPSGDYHTLYFGEIVASYIDY